MIGTSLMAAAFVVQTMFVMRERIGILSVVKQLPVVQPDDDWPAMMGLLEVEASAVDPAANAFRPFLRIALLAGAAYCLAIGAKLLRAFRHHSEQLRQRWKIAAGVLSAAVVAMLLYVTASKPGDNTPNDKLLGKVEMLIISCPLEIVIVLITVGIMWTLRHQVARLATTYPAVALHIE